MVSRLKLVVVRMWWVLVGNIGLFLGVVGMDMG